ncbi:SDR family oxidoreductase [Nocardia amikacinitolerans]|uniref:SDR family oxidoreductase n=1 Tax=Nocardia amikacinitolerans TaxID=756689 RepID=UPI00082C6C54|nr:SDR family oxidoreductase [Nocardia amikacinitolerans]MCP2278382.1 NAD(P)-dependent dehydrogenase, short-chain alcohol dehydrogenase family [Nocardia amikacinitolerans]MCP2299051.1 NAD(P)-dependent dehydrogenase, short-chain alcohol dehydrogenase family [Nocardia amikacinitolerans]MCP2321361.1 NAD(P)-dependent dehydrogenase, short-chain alcohol dehydrogenase family [Nocardia amikacinitolerans]
MGLEIDLTDRVVLVTGGVRGVGAGISKTFLAAGATVIACARRPADAPVAHDGREIEYLPCDVRDGDAVQGMIDAVLARHGRLDTLVNNAGGAPFALAADASKNFHAKIVELNLLAPLLVSQAANAVMQKQDDGGSIVMISSVSGHRPSPGTAAYGAAKAGIDNLTQSLAVEWAPKVRVNSLVVGLVETELTEMHYGDRDGVDAVAATVPLGRMARPEDIGRAAAFLASPLAAYVSGASLPVHGGGERPAFLAASTAAHDQQRA